MKKLITSSLVVLCVLCSAAFADVPLVVENFEQPAGLMPVQNTPPNVSPAWRWNEGSTASAYDGDSSLLMPMTGGWTQYIDTGFTPVSAGESVMFVCEFTMPDVGGQALGFTNPAGNWAAGEQLIFKLSGGAIYVSDDAWATTTDVDTGQTYVANSPQALAIHVATDGTVTLYYRNGDGASWVDITPGTVPAFDPAVHSKCGVNNYGGGGGTFVVDYIGVIKDPTFPPPAESLPANLLIQDDFTGTAGDPPDPATWYVGGTTDPPHVYLDGQGNLFMETNETNWDPYIDTRGLAAVPGTEMTTVEIACKYHSGLQVFGISNAAGDGNGRCFIPQPTGNDYATMALNIGPNSWTASVASSGPYVIDASGMTRYRVTLDPSTDPGTVIYEVFNNGTEAWVDVTPAAGSGDPADDFTVYDKSLSWMPWVMCQGWNGGGPGANMVVDYVMLYSDAASAVGDWKRY